jgi:hypothetical protein
MVFESGHLKWLIVYDESLHLAKPSQSGSQEEIAPTN